MVCLRIDMSIKSRNTIILIDSVGDLVEAIGLPLVHLGKAVLAPVLGMLDVVTRLDRDESEPVCALLGGRAPCTPLTPAACEMCTGSLIEVPMNVTCDGDGVAQSEVLAAQITVAIAMDLFCTPDELIDAY